MRGTRGRISRAPLVSVPFSSASPHSGSFLKPTRFPITVVVFFTIFRTTKPFLTPSAHPSSRMLSRAPLLACVSSADMCSSFNKFSGRGLPRAVVEIFEVPSLHHSAPPFPLCSFFATSRRFYFSVVHLTPCLCGAAGRGHCEHCGAAEGQAAQPESSGK
jgi:hypothetical protein